MSAGGALDSKMLEPRWEIGLAAGAKAYGLKFKLQVNFGLWGCGAVGITFRIWDVCFRLRV